MLLDPNIKVVARQRGRKDSTFSSVFHSQTMDGLGFGLTF